MTTESKSMLWADYSTANFPHLIAHHGPWNIYAQEKSPTLSTPCAAIPVDKTSGHLPSHFGTFAHVERLAMEGDLKILATA